jgi:hypothetical protein
MRYSTAAILSLVLVGGMFVLPAAVLASLKQGLPTPIPGYERILIDVAAFCLSFRFLLVIPILSVLFTVAAFTNSETPARPR